MNFDKEANLEKLDQTFEYSGKPTGLRCFQDLHILIQFLILEQYSILIKDAICRYHRSNGHNLVLIGGYDIHGEPISRALIKEFYSDKALPDDLTLIKECQVFARENINYLRHYIKKLGIHFVRRLFNRF
jgi:hypothetical protein